MTEWNRDIRSMDVLPCWGVVKQGVVDAVPACASKSYLRVKDGARGRVWAVGGRVMRDD